MEGWYRGYRYVIETGDPAVALIWDMDDHPIEALEITLTTEGHIELTARIKMAIDDDVHRRLVEEGWTDPSILS